MAQIYDTGIALAEFLLIRKPGTRWQIDDEPSNADTSSFQQPVITELGILTNPQTLLQTVDFIAGAHDHYTHLKPEIALVLNLTRHVEAPEFWGQFIYSNEGKQGVHQPGHNNYDDTKSPINEDVDPQELLDGAHSGEHEVVGTANRGDPVVDFGEPIGVDVNTGEATQYGTIHSGDNGYN